MDGLKQRVIGAFILVSLAVIFLPMIFDKPHEKSQIQVLSIPIKPEPPIVVIEAPKKPSFRVLEVTSLPEREDAPTEETLKGSDFKLSEKPVLASPAGEKVVVQSEPKRSSVKEAERSPEVIEGGAKSTVRLERPEVKNNPIFQNIWVVQLGVFADHGNAYRLRDRLRKAGYDGHTKELVSNNKTLIKVFTGPFVSKVKAEQLKQKVDKEFSLSSLVVYFED